MQRNRLGIADPTALRRAEADITESALVRLSRTQLPGAYDLDHLRACHRAIFGALYPWVGQLYEDAGYDLRWAGLDPALNASASVASMRGDRGPLRALPDELLSGYEPPSSMFSP